MLAGLKLAYYQRGEHIAETNSRLVMPDTGDGKSKDCQCILENAITDDG